MKKNTRKGTISKDQIKFSSLLAQRYQYKMEILRVENMIPDLEAEEREFLTPAILTDRYAFDLLVGIRLKLQMISGHLEKLRAHREDLKKQITIEHLIILRKMVETRGDKIEEEALLTFHQITLPHFLAADPDTVEFDFLKDIPAREII